jgi:hypothetical protein
MNWPGSIMPHCGCGHLAVGQRHDRLVGEGELGVLERVLERGLDLAPAEHARRQHRLVAAPAALAGGLRRVQGQVRVAQQLVRVAAVDRGGDADGRRRDHLGVTERERPGERGHDPLREHLHRLGVRRVVDEQRELVAAEPRGGVRRAHRRRQPPGHRRQQLVAGAVAHRVVDHLEVVQVDEEDADGALGAARVVERVRHPLGEQHPVRQAGQRVVVGLVLQLLLELVLLGDVTQGEHHAAHGPVAAQVARAHLEHGVAAVEALDPEQEAVRARGDPGQDQVHHPGDVGPRLRVDQVLEPVSLDLDVAEDGGGGRGRVGDQAVVADDQDRVRGVAHQRAEQRLAALPDHLLGEGDALDRQGRLAGQDLEGRRQLGQHRLPAVDAEHPDVRVTGRPVLEHQRAEQGALGRAEPAGVRPDDAELLGRDEPRAVQAGQQLLGQRAQPVTRELIGDGHGRGGGDGDDRPQPAITAHRQQGRHSLPRHCLRAADQDGCRLLNGFGDLLGRGRRGQRGARQPERPFADHGSPLKRGHVP